MLSPAGKKEHGGWRVGNEGHFSKWAGEEGVFELSLDEREAALRGRDQSTRQRKTVGPPESVSPFWASPSREATVEAVGAL